MDQLTIDLKNALMKEGASLVGFADMRALPPETRNSLDYGVSIVVALNPKVVKGIAEAPNRSYFYEFVRANDFLNYLSEFGARFLTEKGYKAVPMGAKAINPEKLSAPLQHKTVATRAGIGWIGKSAMLVTEEFGPAIRLNSVLTDAPLECAVPIEASKCGDCKECMNACPGKAISGNLWDVTKSRDEFFNAMKCFQVVSGFKKSLGLETMMSTAGLCGRCMVVCPKAKKYLKCV
jgi:epoxyqueuosine reductase QueG